MFFNTKVNLPFGVVGSLGLFVQRHAAAETVSVVEIARNQISRQKRRPRRNVWSTRTAASISSRSPKTRPRRDRVGSRLDRSVSGSGSGSGSTRSLNLIRSLKLNWNLKSNRNLKLNRNLNFFVTFDKRPDLIRRCARWEIRGKTRLATPIHVQVWNDLNFLKFSWHFSIFLILFFYYYYYFFFLISVSLQANNSFCTK